MPDDTVTTMIPGNVPTRKQRFDAALKLAGVTLNEWCARVGVTRQHLAFVFAGERQPGPELDAAIDALIATHLTPAQAAEVAP